MVYKFRVILDTEEDIFINIAILAEDTLVVLHNAIFNSFGFSDGHFWLRCCNSKSVFIFALTGMLNVILNQLFVCSSVTVFGTKINFIVT